MRPTEDSIDSYAFHAFAFAIDPSTNLSIDIARFAVADSFDGFTVSSRGMDFTMDFTYDPGNGSTTVEILAHALEIGISRSGFTRALTMCMFATSWFLTVASTYFAFKAVAKGRADFAIVMLHASTGLAISSIQKLYTSPPPLGASLGTLRLHPSVSQFTYVPPRCFGILPTGRHRGLLFHDVGVHRGKVVSIDQRTIQKQ